MAVNASALPESLAEAELFGHEKGAFTGAVGSRPGRFELAEGGTLFLDEIGTLSAAVQSKLLRVLESREVERLGGRRPIPVDFRLISATNEDLEARVSAGTFREDLYYRIHTVPIRIPPLREREGDVRLLAEHFVAALRGAPREGCPRASRRRRCAGFEGHRWRGNVRELQHVVEMLVLFSEGEVIDEADLPRGLRQPAPAGRRHPHRRRRRASGRRSRRSRGLFSPTPSRPPEGSRPRPRAGSASTRTRSSISAGNSASSELKNSSIG